MYSFDEFAYCFLIFLLGKSVKNKFLFTITVYHGLTLTRTMLGQLSTYLWDPQYRPVVIQPGIEPWSVVMPLALRCSTSDRFTTREPDNAIRNSAKLLRILVTDFCEHLNKNRLL